MFKYRLLSEAVNNILSNRIYYAHTKNNNANEKLTDHSNLTIKYFDLYCKKKKIGEVIENLVTACGLQGEEKEICINLFVNAIYLHDIGKINPNYQISKMGNKSIFKILGVVGTEHSIHSAYIYIRECIDSFKINNNKKLLLFVEIFAYVISCHHGNVLNTGKFEVCLQSAQTPLFYSKNLDTFLNSCYFVDLQNINEIKNYVPNPQTFYILARFLFSCITSCDFCATSEYMNDSKMDIKIIEDSKTFAQNYYNGKLYKSIQKYTPKSTYDNINELRCDLFLNAESGLMKNNLCNIFYLEAPTGSGKTNISINLAIKLLKQCNLTNLFYIFPFNTLIEQTKDVLNSYFPNSVTVVNSLSAIGSKEEINDNKTNYNELLLNHMSENYPIVLTSHVNFFQSLFGVSRENVMPLLKLCNSVIVIDEIQSYKNSLWAEIIDMLSYYSRLLNIKIIIMSATLPRLDKILGCSANFVDIISDGQKYYQNPYFKNRVTINDCLLRKESVSFDDIYDIMKKYKDKKILVEFITKKKARNFYNFLLGKQSELGVDIYELTGDDCSITRKEVIEQSKTNKPLIIVATQVIEAGIDIDMDVGFKEKSIFDAEEQFMGRINRSCKRIGIVYFFNGDNPESIYKEDVRSFHTISSEEILNYLREKDFSGAYKYIFNDLYRNLTKNNKNNIQNFYNNCLLSKFDEIKKHMTLIQPSVRIFLPYKIVKNGINYDGYKIWEEYKNLVDSDINYPKKKIMLSHLANEMEFFMFSLTAWEQEKISIPYEKLGGIHYFPDGEHFIKDGKFMREEFLNNGGLFL